MLDIRCVNKENPINIDMIPSGVVQFSKISQTQTLPAGDGYEMGVLKTPSFPSSAGQQQF